MWNLKRFRSAMGKHVCVLPHCLTVLLATEGCSGPSVDLPRMNPRVAGRKAMELYDSDRDGVIEGSEFEQCPGLKAALPTVDTDADEQVTAEEIKIRLKAHRDSGLALAEINCVVTLDGNPLPNAAIQFVPEEYLGNGISIARGTTNSRGTARLATESQELPGINCGFYRVEISKINERGNETLPMRYNVSTILGQEVSQRIPAEGVAHFRLTKN